MISGVYSATNLQLMHMPFGSIKLLLLLNIETHTVNRPHILKKNNICKKQN